MVTEVLSGVKFKMVRVGSGAKRKSSRVAALRAQGTGKRPCSSKSSFSNKWLVKAVRYRNPTSSENV